MWRSCNHRAGHATAQCIRQEQRGDNQLLGSSKALKAWAWKVMLSYEFQVGVVGMSCIPCTSSRLQARLFCKSRLLSCLTDSRHPKPEQSGRSILMYLLFKSEPGEAIKCSDDIDRQSVFGGRDTKFRMGSRNIFRSLRLDVEA